MVIDTNILIYYLKDNADVVAAMDEWKRDSRTLIISAISVAEILSLPKLRSDQEKKIKNYISSFVTVSFDSEVAESAANLRRSHGLPLPDAGIAATAMTKGLPLVTRDDDFGRINQIEVVEI